MPTAAAVSPEPRRPLKGLRWYVCGLLFLVTFIYYVDRVSPGAMNEKALKLHASRDQGRHRVARWTRRSSARLRG